MSEASIVILGTDFMLTSDQIREINDGVNNGSLAKWKKEDGRYKHENKFFTIYVNNLNRNASIQFASERREHLLTSVKRIAYFYNANGNPDALLLKTQHPFFKTIYIAEGESA